MPHVPSWRNVSWIPNVPPWTGPSVDGAFQRDGSSGSSAVVVGGAARATSTAAPRSASHPRSCSAVVLVKEGAWADNGAVAGPASPRTVYANMAGGSSVGDDQVALPERPGREDPASVA